MRLLPDQASLETHCDGVTEFQAEKGRWELDEGKGDIVRDSSVGFSDGVLVNDPRWILGKIGAAIEFPAPEVDVRWPNWSHIAFGSAGLGIADTFAVVFWTKPADEFTHEIDLQQAQGTAGTKGQRYAIWPPHGNKLDGSNKAGFGVSIGSNGVSVYAHGPSYMPPLLVYEHSMIGWHYVAINVEDNVPTLFVDGKKVQTGVKATKSVVFFPEAFGAGPYGNFVGALEDVRVYDHVLSPEAILKHVTDANGGE